MKFSQPKFDLTRTKQQYRFVYSLARHPGYWGGFANGKTWALCARTWIHLLKYPNNRGVICRRLVKELKDTTRHEFFKIIDCNETSIHDHPWVDRWSGQENLLRLKNGSEVYFRHLQDDNALQSLLSLSIRFFGIDQAEEVPKEAFLTLISRIGRTDIDPQTGKKLPPAWGATVGNPAGHNWVWDYWKKKADKYGVNGDYHLEEATTMEGPYVSAEYVKQLKETYPDRWFKRYVLGSWEADGGRIYDEWDEKVHVIDPFPIRDEWKMGIGVDLGYNHPTVFEWVAVDFEGNWYVYDEHTGTEMTPAMHAQIVKAKGIVANGQQLPIYAPHDTMNRSGISGLNYQQAYFDEGLNLHAGNKLKPVVRIMRLKQQLKIDEKVKHPFTGKMGAPKLYVFKNCELLRDNMALYKWKELRPGEDEIKEQPDEVVKVNDDAADALGEWAMGWSSRITPEKNIKRISPEQFDLNAFIEGQIHNRMEQQNYRYAR